MALDWRALFGGAIDETSGTGIVCLHCWRWGLRMAKIGLCGAEPFVGIFCIEEQAGAHFDLSG